MPTKSEEKVKMKANKSSTSKKRHEIQKKQTEKTEYSKKYSAFWII